MLAVVSPLPKYAPASVNVAEPLVGPLVVARVNETAGASNVNASMAEPTTVEIVIATYLEPADTLIGAQETIVIAVHAVVKQTLLGGELENETVGE
jgi:hypothetical protein